jgi:hypothetical protein
MHREGIVHLDLKPGNLLGGRVIDFGTAHFNLHWIFEVAVPNDSQVAAYVEAIVEEFEECCGVQLASRYG